jgi:hypothetical protein
MSNAKHTPKRKRRVKAVPVLGAAGLLSLAGGASAATRVGSGPADAKDRAESRNHKKRTNTATGSSGPSRPYWSADRRNGALRLCHSWQHRSRVDGNFCWYPENR